MSYLLDTNVISELRKGPRCHPRVSEWFSAVSEEEVFLSVLVIGEIRRGVESIRLRDATAGRALERWLDKVVSLHDDQILPVDREIADTWGRMNVPDPIPVLDGLLAATAKVHGLTVATRNVRDVARTGVPCLNPFERPR